MTTRGESTSTAFSGLNTIVRPKKMADMVANRIRTMIARGEVTDGQWLPVEQQLMEEFGVSRPTLREAFRLLEADSLVTIRRGPPGGARVTIPGPEAAAPQFGLLLTLSDTTISDVYEARMIIEPPAARRLAERGTAAERKQLRAVLEEAEAAVDNPAEFGRLTVQFHQAIVQLSGNHTLAVVTAMLGEIIARHTAQLYADARQTDSESLADNRRAIRAYTRLVGHVDARDGELAEQFWVRHMRAARSYFVRDTTDTQIVDLLY